ncbi:hypothetical protein ADL27_15910 [Streptomyces sp. NRRL F-6602]|nr:hypothetical protein ADL27_15910 [Streptomyces sp. NRRL F-6602]
MRTNAAWSAGCASPVVRISPTLRPRSTPGSPATWSAWKWVSTTSGTDRTPSPRRHLSTARGSGPASTTTAPPPPPRPASAASTRASPCPTSQATTRHPTGGHPVNGRTRGAGRTSATSSASAPTAHSHGLPGNRSRTTTSPSTTDTTASPSAPAHEPGQLISAPGSDAPVRAISAMASTGQPASHAHPFATDIPNGAATSAANPSTVAGATANSASRLHGTATRLTCAASTTTTGAHTVCAAAAAASASANRPGHPLRRSPADQRGASVSREPVASTESRKPKSRASQGS